jgi:hypothetical protein
LVGSVLNNQPTNRLLENQVQPEQPEQPEQPDAEPPASGERERSYALLNDPEIVDIVLNTRLHEQKARQYAAGHAFPWLLQQVAAFWRDYYAGKVEKIGALYNRIEKNYRLERYSEEFLASALYQRHYPLNREEAESLQHWLDHREYAGVIRGLTPFTTGDPALDQLLERLPAPIFGIESPDAGVMYDSG